MWTNLGGALPDTWILGVTQPTGKHNYRGLLAVQEDNSDLTTQITIANVQANPGSWLFATSTSILYVHTAGSDDPNDHTMTFDFRLRFAMGAEKPGQSVVLSSVPWYPNVSSVPSVVREANEQIWGTPVTGSGSIVLTNGQVLASSGLGAACQFDDLFESYTWIGSLVKVYYGGDDLPFGEFTKVWTGRVQATEWTDGDLILDVYDMAERLAEFPSLTAIDSTGFPDAAASALNRQLPTLYGSCRDVPAYLTDTTSLEYAFCQHACMAVTKVMVNGVEVVPYDVAAASGFVYLPEHMREELVTNAAAVTVDVAGRTDTSGDLMTNPADVIEDLLVTYGSSVFGDLDSTSFDDSRLASASFHLSMGVFGGLSMRDYLDRICRSILAYLVVTPDGEFSMDVWGPVRADVTPDLDIVESSGAIGSVVVRQDAARIVGGYLVSAAREAVSASDAQETAAISDAFAQQITQRNDYLDVPDTALEDVENVHVLTGRLALLYGWPTMRAVISATKRWMLESVNGVVSLTRSRAPDSSGLGWSARLFRILRIEMEPTTISSTIEVEDLDGNVTANYGTWKAAGTPNWVASSAAQKAAGGYWSGPGAASAGSSLWA